MITMQPRRDPEPVLARTSTTPFLATITTSAQRATLVPAGPARARQRCRLRAMTTMSAPLTGAQTMHAPIPTTRCPATITTSAQRVTLVPAGPALARPPYRLRAMTTMSAPLTGAQTMHAPIPTTRCPATITTSVQQATLVPAGPARARRQCRFRAMTTMSARPTGARTMHARTSTTHCPATTVCSATAWIPVPAAPAHTAVILAPLGLLFAMRPPIPA